MKHDRTEFTSAQVLGRQWRYELGAMLLTIMWLSIVWKVHKRKWEEQSCNSLNCSYPPSKQFCQSSVLNPQPWMGAEVEQGQSSESSRLPAGV